MLPFRTPLSGMMGAVEMFEGTSPLSLLAATKLDVFWNLRTLIKINTLGIQKKGKIRRLTVYSHPCAEVGDF